MCKALAQTRNGIYENGTKFDEFSKIQELINKHAHVYNYYTV